VSAAIRPEGPAGRIIERFQVAFEIVVSSRNQLFKSRLTIGSQSVEAQGRFGALWSVQNPPNRIRRKISSMTRIAVDLPDDIAKRLETAWRDVSRGALEAVALEGYRDGALSRDQVGRLLGLSLWDTEAFLKERQAYLAYNEEDFEQDRRDLDRIAPQ